MAQAKVDESASIQTGNSGNPRAALTDTSAPGNSQQMVQGAKPEPKPPQMGAGTSFFTDWAAI